MRVLQRIFPRKWALMLFISGLLVLLLVPAVVFIHPGTSARASGGGGGGSPVVTIFPTTASPGTQINVQGFNYPSNVTVKIFFQTISNGVVTVVTDQGGFFFTTLNMPSIPFGIQAHLIATGLISGVSASTLVNEIPAVIPNPNAGTIGTTVSLTGGGFGSNEGVRILFQGKLVASPGTNVNGAFKASFVVPDTAKLGFQFNDIVASGKTSGVGASATFTVEPNLSISPNQGSSGTLITVRGSHFTPNDFATILWIFPGTGGSGGSGSNTLFITNVQVSSNGTFNVTITAPGGLVAGQTSFVQAIDDNSGASNQVKFFAV